MKFTTTKPGMTAWLGAGALAGLLIIGAPNAVQAQDTSAVRQDTAAVQQDTAQRAAADTARSDTTQWGRTADQETEVQNPPGYRGMERPVNVFPPDTADTSSAADATTRTSQMQRQDTTSSETQNPPGYRGLERPAGTDTAEAQQGDTGAKAETTKKSGTKKKAKTTKKQTTTQRDTAAADTTMRRDTSAMRSDTTAGQETEMRQSQQTGDDTRSTVRVGEDTTGDTTRYEVNAEEGRTAAGATGEASRDSADVIHRERETPPGMGSEPPPYPSDSEQVWVEQQPSGDSVNIGFDSTASNQQRD